MQRFVMLVLIVTAVPVGMRAVSSRVTGGVPVVLQEKTVRDGVFTENQASRGREQYDSICQRCHGIDLTGGAGRSLTGDVFLRDWTGLTLDSLLERMQSMPPGDAESLAVDVYVDIISYLLERNGFPAGRDELSTELLDGIRVEGEYGPDVVPNYALVWVVGCLTGSAADGWLLSDASGEVRTADPEPSSGDALVEVLATPLEDRTFQLMYVFPSPEAYVGHKVETKGLLIRGPTDSLNVTSLQSLAPRCGWP